MAACLCEYVPHNYFVENFVVCFLVVKELHTYSAKTQKAAKSVDPDKTAQSEPQLNWIFTVCPLNMMKPGKTFLEVS